MYKIYKIMLNFYVLSCVRNTASTCHIHWHKLGQFWVEGVSEVVMGSNTALSQRLSLKYQQNIEISHRAHTKNVHYNRLDGSTLVNRTIPLARGWQTVVYDIVDGCFAFLMFCLVLFTMYTLHTSAIEIQRLYQFLGCHLIHTHTEYSIGSSKFWCDDQTNINGQPV